MLPKGYWLEKMAYELAQDNIWCSKLGALKNLL